MKLLYRNQRKIILILVFIIFILYSAEVVAKNGSSAFSFPVNQLEDQVEALKTENAVLAQEVLTAQSLTVISIKAKEIGFIESKKVFVVR